MMRWAGIAVLSLLVTACAAKPEVRPAAKPLAAEAPVRPPPDLTNRELMDLLAREGVGKIVTGESDRPQQERGESLETEIRETPRGVVVTFRYILFAFDSAQLSPVARREVERFALVLNHSRVLRRSVTVEGHADSIGSDAYNTELSRRRATAVAEELMAHGVRRDRVAVEAYGERRPLAPNTHADGTDNPAGRTRNRRAEAVIEN
jgi:outer membrane protein OmpA-like peptidoglycan-associated protein